MRHLFELLTICRENLGLGYKTHISAVMIHDRKVPCSRVLELLHHAVLIYGAEEFKILQHGFITLCIRGFLNKVISISAPETDIYSK